jgi:F0F1-type ATP synthase assembly protein I
MQYLAGGFVGVGVGWLIDNYTWSAWPFAPIPFAILGAVLMGRLWNALPGSHHGAPAKTAAQAKPAAAAQ